MTAAGERRGWLLRRWRELLVLSASTLIALLAIDRGLILVYPAFQVDGSLLIPDDELGWALRPNHFRSKVGARTNSAGFRGSEFVARGDQPIVAFVGDSVTYGATTDRNTFPHLFEELSGWRSFNFGVPAYGPIQYRKLLKTVLPYRPDFVVVGFFIGNDVAGCRPDVDFDFEVREGKNVSWTWSGIYRLLLFRGVLDLPGPGQDWDLREPVRTGDQFTDIERRRSIVFRSGALAGRWECVEENFRAMAEQRSDIIVLILPDEMQVDPDLWDEVVGKAADPGEYDLWFPNRRSRRLARKAGLRPVDVTPALRAERRRTYFRWDSHPNPLGNRIIASELFEVIGPDLRTVGAER